MKWDVEFQATIHGTVEVEAKSDTEAAQKAQQRVEEDGYIVTKFHTLAEPQTDT